MTILFSKAALKTLKKYDKKTVLRILEAIEKLPDEGDIKKYHSNELPPLFRLRVGKYRIIFQILENEIKIIKMDTRGDIYKNI